MIKIANNLVKLADIKQDIAGFFNPEEDNASNYGIVGALGVGLGAPAGLLIEYLSDKKEKNYLKSLLLGGLTGGAAMIGSKALSDATLGDGHIPLTREDLLKILPKRFHDEILKPTVLDRWEASRKGELNAWNKGWNPNSSADEALSREAAIERQNLSGIPISTARDGWRNGKPIRRRDVFKD
jgi:hypothetical protein